MYFENDERGLQMMKGNFDSRRTLQILNRRRNWTVHMWSQKDNMRNEYTKNIRKQRRIEYTGQFDILKEKRIQCQKMKID